MKTLSRLFLRIEAGFHYADAYLAYQRGEHVIAARCEQRARECERKLDVMEVNHG
jgi:hypothetical protein